MMLCTPYPLLEAAVVVEAVVEVGVGVAVEGGGTDSREERRGEGGGG